MRESREVGEEKEWGELGWQKACRQGVVYLSFTSLSYQMEGVGMEGGDDEGRKE